ncbi:MAG TPA: hypothetical protein VFY34_13635 [Pyrinomonadaceae bacterium]|nr:hypothetical protein [Pyrinomonadaceae bacterium]
MKKLAAFLVVLCSACIANAQGANPGGVVALNEPAVATDGSGAGALEATLKTTALYGSPDAPVTNVRMVVKNMSSIPYAFVAGVVTFYDGAGVRCGEGIFKADVLAAAESFETDTPGLRIRCEAASWRIVATHLLPSIPPNTTIATLPRAPQNLVIVIDGQSHPIQLDRPLVVTMGERRRTIVVRAAP